MMVSVVKVWKVGATISALVSFAALIVHLQYSSQPTRSKSLEVPATEVWHFGGFDAWWADSSGYCERSESCVYVVIEETQTCRQDVLVKFTVTDKKDLFIDSQTKVISASEFRSGDSFEIGTDTLRVEYFSVDSVTCGNGLDTTQHNL
jgi:hypothetical protein